MSKRPERHLSRSLEFGEGLNIWENRDTIPWPTQGDSLLEAPIGDEDFIHPDTWWTSRELERVGTFAFQYQTCARQLVSIWAKSQPHAETVVYAIGYLYRHAVELSLKTIIVDGPTFNKLDAEKQRALLRGHSLHRLWNNAKLALHLDSADADEVAIFERQLLQLHALDMKSDGFRYPFGYDEQGHRKPLLDDLWHKSFPKFLWILDGLCNWLSAAQDAEADFRRSVDEMKEYYSDY